MKKKKIQNIIIGIIAISVIGVIAGYNYSVDQTKQTGLQFGKELEQIQNDVTELQSKFYSEKTKWEEGDVTKEELLEFYEKHLKEFNEIISEYDELTPPTGFGFQSSIDLLKLSSETQLASDSQFIEWMNTGDESAKIRSDTLIQESFDYELQGLVEYFSAKTGIKNYDEDAKFEAPQSGLTQKVIQVAENMASKCDEEFKNESGEFDSDEIEVEWFNCINEAKKWKIDHLP